MLPFQGQNEQIPPNGRLTGGKIPTGGRSFLGWGAKVYMSSGAREPGKTRIMHDPGRSSADI